MEKIFAAALVAVGGTLATLVVADRIGGDPLLVGVGGGLAVSLGVCVALAWTDIERGISARWNTVTQAHSPRKRASDEAYCTENCIDDPNKIGWVFCPYCGKRLRR